MESQLESSTATLIFKLRRASSGKLDSKQRQHLQGLKDEEIKQEEQLDEEKI